MFGNDTRYNCAFGGHLAKAIKECGCVTWKHPKLNGTEKSCSKVEETACFEGSFTKAKEEEKCPKCIDECNKVNYEYTIHTKQLKNHCQENEMSGSVNKKNKNINDNVLNYLPEDYNFQEMGLRLHLFQYCFFYTKKNTAVVDFFIGPATVVQITSRPRVTFEDQLGSIGNITASIIKYCNLLILCHL